MKDMKNIIFDLDEKSREKSEIYFCYNCDKTFPYEHGTLHPQEGCLCCPECMLYEYLVVMTWEDFFEGIEARGFKIPEIKKKWYWRFKK